MKEVQEFIDEIFNEVRDLSDADYCDYLDEISIALDSAVVVKREEMDGEEK